MKIAVPLANGRLAMHFGHCEQFAFFEVDQENKKILGKSLAVPPAHEPGSLPAWMHQQGANVIISGGMGEMAQSLFAKNEITVVLGAAAEEPEKIVQAYLDGELQAGENICDH